MYTFSRKLKTFSLALIIIGALGIGYGFFTAPKTTDDVKEMLHQAEDSHGVTTVESADDHQVSDEHAVAEVDSEDLHASEEAHLEHALMQAQNRPWAAVYISLIFFLLIAVCIFVFYAVQRASSAGWSPVLFRVMEALSAFIIPGSVLVLFVFSTLICYAR